MKPGDGMSVKQKVLSRGWEWWDNGLTGGQLQVNITHSSGRIVSWWPFSARQTAFVTRGSATTGRKKLKHFNVDFEDIIEFCTKWFNQSDSGVLSEDPIGAPSGLPPPWL